MRLENTGKSDREKYLDLLAEKYPAPVRRIGLQDVFGYSGPMAQLMVEFGLDETNIVKTVKEFLAE